MTKGLSRQWAEWAVEPGYKYFADGFTGVRRNAPFTPGETQAPDQSGPETPETIAAQDTSAAPAAAVDATQSTPSGLDMTAAPATTQIAPAAQALRDSTAPDLAQNDPDFDMMESPAGTFSDFTVHNDVYPNAPDIYAYDEAAAKRMREIRDEIAKAESGISKNNKVGFRDNDHRDQLGSNSDQTKSMMSDLVMQQTYQQAYTDFEETYNTAKNAANDVLFELNQEEERLRKKLKELDDNALHLSNGMLAYVSDNGQYVDQAGNILTGNTHAEAAAAHKQYPNATHVADREQTLSQLQTSLETRRQVKAYIEKFDELKEKAARGEMTAEELNTTKSKLLDEMPTSIRRRFDEIESQKQDNSFADSVEATATKSLRSSIKAYAESPMTSAENTRTTSYAKNATSNEEVSLSISENFTALSKPMNQSTASSDISINLDQSTANLQNKGLFTQGLT